MSFELWRQDDNGNRFLICSYAERSAAEAQLDRLTRVLHRQTYWLEEKTDGERPCCSGGD